MNATYEALRSELVALLTEQRARRHEADEMRAAPSLADLTHSIADVLAAASPKSPDAYSVILADAAAIVDAVFGDGDRAG